MSDDTLFDASVYGEEKGRRQRKRPVEPVLSKRPPGYHLVTNNRGVQGFHRTRVPEAAMARHGSCVTYCGIVGRRLDEYPTMIPLCEACELEHREKS